MKRRQENGQLCLFTLLSHKTHYIYLFIFKYVEIETRYLLLTSGEKNLSDRIFILECLNLPNRNISSRQVFN